MKLLANVAKIIRSFQLVFRVD